MDDPEHPLMNDPDHPFLLLNSIGAFIIGLTVLVVMLARDAVAGIGLTIAGLGLAVGIVGFIGVYRRSRRK
ncbi:hypothetical protein [Kocuria kalidii]|uniref:hypothetical protein n=1 Tax=Kocuria kalidii TaxID=3376283 RepID=UPI0037BCBDE0